ncbi:MAG: ribulose-phosphate 3-epimerase [Candidatus Levybacteria bacterium]|nr:ribulose-phosphate 3-epimerase [Candidatus Levybacteria bacterium]
MTKDNYKYKLGASLISAGILHLEREIKALERAKIDYIHFDVMDGIFVPRMGLFPEMLKAIKSKTFLPINVHMMTIDPESHIKNFAEAGAERIIIHTEATKHLHNSIMLIKKYGVKAGVALNPATPLSALDYILEDIDMVLIMAINPGIIGHKFIPAIFNKISDLRLKLLKYPNILIEVDGGISFDNAAKVIQKGAHLIVCGSQTIFKPETSLSKNIKEIRNIINKS